MANYYCTSRSNYFEVKNPQAFYHWAKNRGLKCWHKEDDEEGRVLYAVAPAELDDRSTDDGSWPGFDWATGKEFDLFEELSQHLADDWVAVFMQAGAEKMRYVSGFATAIDSKGERIDIALHDIYQRAEEEFGAQANITPAEY